MPQAKESEDEASSLDGVELFPIKISSLFSGVLDFLRAAVNIITDTKEDTAKEPGASDESKAIKGQPVPLKENRSQDDGTQNPCEF